MQKSQEGSCFVEARSSVHQRSFIIEVGCTISIQSHELKNDLKEPNYRKSLISEKLRWDPIGVHWIAETSRTLEIRSLLANFLTKLADDGNETNKDEMRRERGTDNGPRVVFFVVKHEAGVPYG